MATKWQRFEQLVAALHRVEMKGAVVVWNDIINGRQFDVTVRFENGPYKYLTVVECKDAATSVPVEQIESLVTKAKYVGADKAVVFSSYGFQSGAVNAAQLYGIHLFSLSQLDDVPDQFLVPDKVEYIQIYDVVLVKPNGSRFVLPEEPMRLKYYVNETILTYPARDIILAELIRGYEHKLDGCAVDDVLYPQVKLVPPGRTTFPSMERDEPILVSFVQWKMVNRVGRPLKDRRGYDPALFVMPYEIKDILSGNIRYLEGDAIEGAELTDVTPGNFYRFRNWGIYYCEAIDDELARMILIECYQHGKFVQAKFTVRGHNIRGYEEVTNSDDLERLHWRLREWYKIG